jgi:hypothetical protein
MNTSFALTVQPVAILMLILILITSTIFLTICPITVITDLPMQADLDVLPTAEESA